MIVPYQKLLIVLILAFLSTYLLYRNNVHEHFKQYTVDKAAQYAAAHAKPTSTSKPDTKVHEKIEIKKPDPATCDCNTTAQHAPAKSAPEKGKTPLTLWPQYNHLDTNGKAPKFLQLSMNFEDEDAVEKSDGNPWVVHQQEYTDVYKKAYQSHYKHAERWGYPTYVLKQDTIGQGDWRIGCYNKIMHMLSVVAVEMGRPASKRAQWFVWFDGDTILLNELIDWAVFVPPEEEIFKDVNVIASKDWVGFQSGVMMMRICEWSLHVLTQAMGFPFFDEKQFETNEQEALGQIINTKENQKHQVFQPLNWWNKFDPREYGQVLPVPKGCINLHFPGGQGGRVELMSYWFEKMEKEIETLQVPFEETEYPQQIDEFWAHTRKAFKALQDAEKFEEEYAKHHPSEDSPSELAQAIEQLEETAYHLTYNATQLDERVHALESLMRGSDDSEHSSSEDTDDHHSHDHDAASKNSDNDGADASEHSSSTKESAKKESTSHGSDEHKEEKEKSHNELST